MFTECGNLKSLARAATLALLPLVAACGGGGDDGATADNNGSGSNPIACIIVILASGQTDCVNGSNSSKTSSVSQSTGTSTSPTAGSSIPSTGRQLQGNQEFESNDELANANLPLAPTRTTIDTPIGWYVAGSIDDVSDTRDAFAFTPDRTGEYVIALCPPEGSRCNKGAEIDSLTAFLRVLDQDGNVLLTSQANADTGNNQQTTFDAGVFYYVTVDAGDTMGVTVDYRLFVYENQ